MKFIFSFILGCWLFPVYSQFAFIEDRDGYVNIRSAAALVNNIEDSLSNDHLVFCTQIQGNWAYIDYIKNGALLNGYVYRNRLKVVENLEPLPKLEEQPLSVYFAKDSVEVTVTAQPFVRSKHKLFYSLEYPGIIELVNGKLPYGTDGNLPQLCYHSINIRIGHRQILLPHSEYDDLFEPNLASTKINYNQSKDTLFLHSRNSEGESAYFVIWRFENGEYKDRFIAYGM